MTPEPTTAPARPLSDIGYYLLAAAAGALAGCVGSAFHMLVDIVSTWPDRLVAVLDGPHLYLALSGVAAAMLVAAVAVVRIFAPEASGSGVQEIEGAMEGLREVRWKRVLPVKFVGGTLALGAGLASGREGPTIHMGASIAQAFSNLFGLSTRDSRGLLAAGGAAGLAAAFNAPLASILFVIEETRRQFPYGLRTYAAVIICSATSAVMTELLGGQAPDMRMIVPEMPLVLIPAFILLGAVLGVVGVVFNSVLVAALDAALWLGRHVSAYLFPACVGLLLGPLLVLRPEAAWGGEHLAVILPGLALPATTLAIIVAVRFAMTMVSYATGVPAGIFAPILALASAIGVLFATLMQAVLPLPDGAAAALAAAAMGGLFSSTVRAPLVGIVLVAELTGVYTLLLPVIFTCITAHLVAHALGGEPIYEVLLNRTLRLAGTPVTPQVDGDGEKIGGWDQTEKRS